MNIHWLIASQDSPNYSYPCNQQHNALVTHSLNFFVAKKSVPKVDKLTLNVLLAMDPVNVSQIFAPRPNLVLAALIQRDN
jgi:hypothetical protein